MTFIEESLRDAVELAEGVPENFRVPAFTTILAHLLSGASPPLHPESTAAANKENGQSSTDLIAEQLILPEGHIVKERGSRQQQVAWVAMLLHGEQSVAVTTNAIRAAIRQYLGITPQSAANTAGTLQQLTPKYFTRHRDGRGYTYAPTKRAVEIFEGLNE